MVEVSPERSQHVFAAVAATFAFVIAVEEVATGRDFLAGRQRSIKA